MNNYFASVEMINHPEYKNIPMAVCGDPATRHGIILAKNYPAKALGILTGESVYSAREKVPELKLIAADYEKYIKYAAAARRIYSDYSCDVVPYGMDEAWLRFPAHDADSLEGYKKAYKTAYIIKERIKRELRLTASVGVSYNYVFSKLASDMKKPDAVTVLQKSQLRSIIWNIPAYEMLFVGPATRKKLCGHNILTIGDIAGSDPVVLSKLLGKTGYNLWQFANGDDSAFNPKVSEDEPYKSIGNTITLPKDAESAEDIYALMYSISKAASVRLRKHKIKSRCVGIKIKYADFSTLNRQVSLQNYTDDPNHLLSRQNAFRQVLLGKAGSERRRSGQRF